MFLYGLDTSGERRMNLVIHPSRQTSLPFLLMSDVFRASPANETYQRSQPSVAVLVSGLEK
jgi:hypothetical protein